MPLIDTLAPVDGDLAAGRVPMARQRLRGLVSSFPTDLTLRRRLAEVYRLYGEPAEVGCWMYLEEDRRADEIAAFRGEVPDAATTYEGTCVERTRVAGLFRFRRESTGGGKDGLLRRAGAPHRLGHGVLRSRRRAGLRATVVYRLPGGSRMFGGAPYDAGDMGERARCPLQLIQSAKAFGRPAKNG